MKEIILFLKIALLSLCTLSQHLFSEKLEIHSLDEVLLKVSSNTLVVLDIDETLLTTSQMLGSDFWFQNKIQKYAFEGLDKKEALAKTLPDYINFLTQSKVKLIESQAPVLVHKLQRMGVTVVGLTSRSSELAYVTTAQLQSLNINLNRTPIKLDELGLSSHLPHHYFEGILYSKSLHKGKVLLDLINHTNFPIDRLVFVDDKMEYIQELQETCEANQIEYTGLRYARRDGAAASYDPAIADVQEKYFKEILSNEDAEKILLYRRSHD